MAVRGMYLLPCGELTIDRGLVTFRRGMGSPVTIPVLSALLDTDDGYLLWDTGVNPDALVDAQATLGHKASVLTSYTAADDVRARLQELGVSPGDVRWVVMSHLHWDHTGGLRFFPQSTVVVQRAEYRFALYPDRFGADVYLRHEFDTPLGWELIEGDRTIVPGVMALFTPGHSPGHQSLLVDLPESGPAILTADAAYTKQNFAEDIPPGNACEPQRALDSMWRLRALAQREGARLFVTHDPEFWIDHRAAPFCYR